MSTDSMIHQEILHYQLSLFVLNENLVIVDALWKTRCKLLHIDNYIDIYNSYQNFDKIDLFSEKKLCPKDLFLIYILYTWSMLLLERQTTLIQIQRDQKKLWDFKILVIWMVYPWECNRLQYQYIKLLVHFILIIPHPSCIDFTNKKNPTQT